MRYLIAIASGALLAVLPLLLLASSDLAWWQSCMSVANSFPVPDDAYELVENPCGMTHRRPVEPLWAIVLNISMLMIGCVMSGALAARLSETRRVVVAFLSPFLAYVALISLGGPNEMLSPVAVAVALAAGLLGIVGPGWEHLTNAWRATRAKPRAPQA
jgi:hypothetical protein